MTFESLYDKKRCATESGVGVGICFGSCDIAPTVRALEEQEINLLESFLNKKSMTLHFVSHESGGIIN
jgi:hypothetical protein